MTNDQFYEQLTKPKTALQVSGWLLTEFEVKAIVEFEAEVGGLAVPAFVEGSSSQHCIWDYS